MRNLLALVLTLGTLLSAPVAVTAQDSNTAIENVITGQMTAFSERDVEEAWRYASPFIQSMFGNAQNFGMMVERGYPMVWNNDAVRFMDLKVENGRTLQQIQLRDADGGVHYLQYEMIETPEGWQINGVSPFEPDLAA